VTTPTPVWKFARESTNVFAGPLTLTVTANNTPVDNADVKFAVLPAQQRPIDTDWTAPVANPDTGVGGVGVVLDAVSTAGLYGWWVQVTVSGAVDVLEPPEVAWVART